MSSCDGWFVRKTDFQLFPTVLRTHLFILKIKILHSSTVTRIGAIDTHTLTLFLHKFEILEVNTVTNFLFESHWQSHMCFNFFFLFDIVPVINLVDRGACLFGKSVGVKSRKRGDQFWPGNDSCKTVNISRAV